MGERASHMAEIPPFDRLDRSLLERVAELVQPFRVEQNGWLVRQGADPDGHLLVLTDGEASIVSEAGGEEQVVGRCRAGDLAGVTGALTGDAHPVGVRADTAVIGLRVPPEALSLCLESPDFAAYFSRMLAHRLRHTYGELGEGRRYRTLDTHPFLRPVRELMRSPAVTCLATLPVAEAARLLRDRRVSSVVVEDEGRPVGIATGTDLVTKVLAAGLSVSAPVSTIMTAPMVAVSETATSYEAMLTMVKGGFKHLPVLGPDGQVTGMVTLGDLARARGEGALAVAYRLDRAGGVAELADLTTQLDSVLRVLVKEGARPSQTLAIMTTLHDRVMRRLIDLGMTNLGPAPCDWCWLSLGSAGREEQFARTDQDHALIYTADTATADTYFANMARFVVEGLERCGFPPCPGDVMPTNPAWRRSLWDWRLAVLAMGEKPDPDQIRQATIFLDFRPVAGNRALAAALQEQVWVAVESFPLFLYHLVRDDLTHPVPVGPFRTIRTPLWGKHKGQINLKADACVHVVDLLRALALQYRVPATSTPGRLAALVKLGAIGRREGDWLDTAYDTLMRLRMEDAVRRKEASLPPTVYIALDTLREPDRHALRDALIAVARLQETVGQALAPGGFR